MRRMIALCFAFILCFGFMPVSNVFAANMEENETEKVQNELEQYFVDFFNTLLNFPSLKTAANVAYSSKFTICL